METISVPRTLDSRNPRTSFDRARSARTSSTHLPSYDTAQIQPPAYRAVIGDKVTPLLVRQYLLLLASFSYLERTVRATRLTCPRRPIKEGGCSSSGCRARLGESCKWTLFLEMAARRFGVWQDKLIAHSRDILPPLDVLLIWATYLHCPSW